MGNATFNVTNGRWTGEDGVFNTTIMCVLGRAVALIPELEEWEFFLEDWKPGEDIHDPHYWLQITSDKGKGTSCADQKIDTLINHPEIGNTGELRKTKLPDGEVSWYGGVQLPYVGFEPHDAGDPVFNQSKPALQKVTGIVRVAFSGAREAVDLGIVLDVLRAYIAACDEHLLGYSYIYDWSKLKADQLCNYLMAQKGIIA